MADRFLARAWWSATMSLILGCALGSLVCAYHGVFEAFAQHYGSASTFVAHSIPLAIATYSLCKHRGDLVCD